MKFIKKLSIKMILNNRDQKYFNNHKTQISKKKKQKDPQFFKLKNREN
jgi:hypothetical protein